jgi:hypothetical protein
VLVTSQLPIKRWHAQFKDPTLADAILDRLTHNAEMIELTGESMRDRNQPSATTKEGQQTRLKNTTLKRSPSLGSHGPERWHHMCRSADLSSAKYPLRAYRASDIAPGARTAAWLPSGAHLAIGCYWPDAIGNRLPPCALPCSFAAFAGCGAS